jgi:hypothetical protein
VRVVRTEEEPDDAEDVPAEELEARASAAAAAAARAKKLAEKAAAAAVAAEAAEEAAVSASAARREKVMFETEQRILHTLTKPIKQATHLLESLPRLKRAPRISAKEDRNVMVLNPTFTSVSNAKKSAAEVLGKLHAEREKLIGSIYTFAQLLNKACDVEYRAYHLAREYEMLQELNAEHKKEMTAKKVSQRQAKMENDPKFKEREKGKRQRLKRKLGSGSNDIKEDTVFDL